MNSLPGCSCCLISSDAVMMCSLGASLHCKRRKRVWPAGGRQRRGRGVFLPEMPPIFLGSFGNLEAKLCIFGRFCASFSAGMGQRRFLIARAGANWVRFVFHGCWPGGEGRGGGRPPISFFRRGAGGLRALVDARVSAASTNSILQAGHEGFGPAVAATR